MKNDANMYQKMYYHLFNAVTDVIQSCKDKECVEILKQAQLDTEEIFITYYE
ncbi:MAG: hypothetical protein IJO44_03130 [Clostridia bacterium]|nr:hypothetical protein [Clostridia bacterium]